MDYLQSWKKVLMLDPSPAVYVVLGLVTVDCLLDLSMKLTVFWFLPQLLIGESIAETGVWDRWGFMWLTETFAL